MSDRNTTLDPMGLIRMAEEYAPHLFQLYSSVRKFCNFLFNCFLWIIAWMASRHTESQPNDQTLAQTRENQRQMLAPTKTNRIKNGEAPSLSFGATGYFLSVVLLSVFSENPRNTFFSIFAENRKRPVEDSTKASRFALSTYSGHVLETGVSIISRLMFAVASFFAFTYAYSFMLASDKDKRSNHPTPKNSILSLMFRSANSVPPPVPIANAYDPHATR